MKKAKELLNEIKGNLKTSVNRNKYFDKVAHMPKWGIIGSSVLVVFVIGAIMYLSLYTPELPDGGKATTNIGSIAKEDFISGAVDKADKKDDAEKKETESATDEKSENTPENKTEAPSNATAPSNSNSTPAPSGHVHDWKPNMITIPGTPDVWETNVTFATTETHHYLTFADGCEYETTSAPKTAAEHTALHGEQTYTHREETEEIPEKVTKTIVTPATPERQEQHGWICSCGATKE